MVVMDMSELMELELEKQIEFMKNVCQLYKCFLIFLRSFVG